MRALRAAVCRLFPIGPLIRQKLERYLPPPSAHWLGPFDWTPTFDLGAFGVDARPSMVPPFTIGRLGRDSAEKWLENADALRQAYPADADSRVHVLGGADGARRVLGTLPDNWRVTPFGGEPPADFLARLDAFVYFPHSGLREAFGRGVVEAICAGRPCILPEQLRAAFGDLAFFCAPAGVADVVRRLAEDDATRLLLADHTRRIVEAGFESRTPFLRLAQLEALDGVLPAAGATLPPKLAAFKNWVETA